jgi:hypothetical protein
MGMVISHVIIHHNLFNNVKSKQKIYQEKKDEYQYYKLEDEILISNTS